MRIKLDKNGVKSISIIYVEEKGVNYHIREHNSYLVEKENKYVCLRCIDSTILEGDIKMDKGFLYDSPIKAEDITVEMLNKALSDIEDDKLVAVIINNEIFAISESLAKLEIF